MKKIIITSVIAFFLINAMDVNAKQSRRSEKWETSFQVLGNNSVDINGENGSGTDIDSEVGFGLSIGYNFNPHFLVNFDWQYSKPDYKAVFTDENGDVTRTIKHEMSLFHSQFNAVYNFTREQFTPFVQAGVGWTYVDSNVANGPPVGGCWYDPWWGYICDSYQSTYNDNRLSYNVAAGVRYELDNSLFFKLSYKQQWVDLSNSSDASVGIYQFEIGTIF